MTMLRYLSAAVLLAALSCSAPSRGAVELGDPLPDLPLVEFSQTEARSLKDTFGQALLLEFFAHW